MVRIGWILIIIVIIVIRMEGIVTKRVRVVTMSPGQDSPESQQNCKKKVTRMVIMVVVIVRMVNRMVKRIVYMKVNRLTTG